MEQPAARKRPARGVRTTQPKRDGRARRTQAGATQPEAPPLVITPDESPLERLFRGVTEQPPAPLPPASELDPVEAERRSRTWTLTYTARPASDAERLADQLRVEGLTIVNFAPERREIAVRVPVPLSPRRYLEQHAEIAEHDNAPRPLRPEEIEDIVNDLPEPLTVDPFVRAKLAEQNRARVRAQLRAARPINPLGIPLLKAHILVADERTLAPPGHPIGMLAASSLGELFTQLVLSQHRTSGSAKTVQVGFVAIREVLLAKRHPSQPVATIYLRNNRTPAEQMLRKRLAIEEVTIDRLATGAKYTVLERDEFVAPWWHDLYLATTRKTLPPGDIAAVARLTLDPSLLYAYGVSLGEIASAIEVASRKHSRDRETASVVCAVSPAHIGVIYIHPNTEMATDAVGRRLGRTTASREDIARYFLIIIVQQETLDIHLRGLADIRRLYPRTAPVWQIVAREERVFRPERIRELPEAVRNVAARAWFLMIDTYRARAAGISAADVRHYCSTAGLVLSRESDRQIAALVLASGEPLLDAESETRVFVLTPAGQPPSEIIRARLGDARREFREQQDQAAQTPNMPPPVAPPIVQAENISFFEAEGTNLPELLLDPEIDPSRTTSNSLDEIYRMYGAVAARLFIVRRIQQNIAATGSNLNVRHITLIAEMMTFLGEPLPVTYFGLARQQIDALSMASYERSMEVFGAASVAGRTEDVRNVSAALYVGRPVPVGTGFMQVVATEAEKRDLEEQLDAGETITADEIAAATEESESIAGMTALPDLDFDYSPTFFEDGVSSLPDTPIQTSPGTAGVPEHIPPRTDLPRPQIPLTLPRVVPQLLEQAAARMPVAPLYTPPPPPIERPVVPPDLSAFLEQLRAQGDD